MRFIRFRNSQLRLCGFGIQWGEPLTVAVKDRAGRLMGLMLNYGRDVRKAVDAHIGGVERSLLPVCEECHTKEASLWCRTHGRYVCLECCAITTLHIGCKFFSIAAKEAMLVR